MMRQKKGGFFTFLCSLIPGAAEMHMGFMKEGISLMAIFILCFVIPSVLRVSDVFILFAVLVWFYSFFHARNLATCSEVEFEAQMDEYIWVPFLEGREIKIANPTLRKWGAIILIVFGCGRLWDSLSEWFYSLVPERYWNILSPIVSEVPQVVVSIAIIILGVKLIVGKKEELKSDEQ